MAVVHHDQPVAVGNGVTHIVGDHHGGQVVLFHDPLGGFQHLCGGLGVQGSGVLVQQQQLRLLQGGHQQRQGLTLAAGEQAHLGGHPVLQSQIQDLQLLHVPLPVSARNALFQGPALAPTVCQGQILFDPHGGGRAHHGVLENTAQVHRPLEFGKPGDVLAVQDDGTRVHLDGTGYGVQHGRLARAVAADDGNKVSVVQCQIQPLQRRLRVDGARIEGLGYILDFQHYLSPPAVLAAFLAVLFQ